MMSDPLVFKPIRDEAWVAPCCPPLFLSSSNEFMAEGGRNYE